MKESRKWQGLGLGLGGMLLLCALAMLVWPANTWPVEGTGDPSAKDEDLPVTLKAVSFGGSGYNSLKKDNGTFKSEGTTVIVAPHWTDKGKREPICYVGRSTPQITKACFNVPADKNGKMANVMVTAKEIDSQKGEKATLTYNARLKLTSPVAITYDLAAEAALARVIANGTYSLKWEMQLDDGHYYEMESENPLYVNAGTPVGSSNTTVKRMYKVTDIARGQSTAQDIADVIGPDAMGSSRCNPNGASIFAKIPLPTAWQVLDGPIMADCGTLATLMKYELDMLGASGSYVTFVYARHDNWNGLCWGPPPSHSRQEHRISNNDGTRLGYVNTGWNDHEGCCVYDDRWWMGGIGQSSTSALEVLMFLISPNNDPAGHRQCYFDLQNQFVKYPGQP